MSRADTPPRNSVVMPLYNAESTCVRAIESALGQTDADLELVVVDDGSTDGSIPLVESLAERDPRVRLVRHDRNRGVSAALNTGVEAARGEIVAIVASDDRLHPSFLAHVNAAMDDDVDIVVCGHTLFRPDGSRTNIPGGRAGRYTGHQAAVMAMHDRITALSADKAMRRSLMLQVPFPEGLRRFEDMVTNIALHSRARHVRIIPEPLYGYTMHAGSATWGRVSPPQEVEAALAHLAACVDPTLTGRSVERALRSLRVLCLMLSAQSAMNVREFPEEARSTVAECARQISFPDLLAAVGARPDYAGGALLLKVMPRAYRALYLRYSSRLYRV